MLPYEFILTDVHFAVSLLAGLACFATMWLYLDAWAVNRRARVLLQWAGFGLLALGFVADAAQVEPVFLSQSIFSQVGTVGMIVRAVGYVLLAVGLALEPLQPVPKVDGPEAEFGLESDPGPVAPQAPAPQTVVQPGSLPPAPLPAGVAAGVGLVQPGLALGAGVVAFLYFRRAIKGLERHLMPVAWAFTWLAVFELLSAAALLRGSQDPRLYPIVEPFGVVWIVDLGLLAMAGTVLILWVWRYLTQRIQTQLFMVITTASLTIFLATTVSFTFLLMGKVQSQAYSQLETTAKVLNATVAAQQTKTDAAARVVAENPAVAAALVAGDHAALVKLFDGFLAEQQQSSLQIANADGKVLLRAEDPTHWGDSVSSSTLVERASVGLSMSGLMTDEASLEPKLVMQATRPVRDAAGKVVGSVVAGFVLDNAFADGLQKSSGLAAAIYSQSTRVATSVVAADGASRLVGYKQTQAAITNQVLKHGKVWSGLDTTDGRKYLAVYAPLRDTDNAVVGMLFVGQPQLLLLQAAGQSIALTFLIAIGLLVLAVGPVHLIARSLARQLR